MLLHKGDVAKIERQWNHVKEVEWHHKYKGTDVKKFWADVLRYTDAAGDQAFKELALFVSACPSM